MTDLMNEAERQTREARNDPRATHELVTTILTRPDGDMAWEAIVMLHLRGTREVFDTARRLCASPCPLERSVGADILGQLGVPDRTFPRESVAVLLQLLERETEVRVIESACFALSHTSDPSAVQTLVRFKKHPSDRLRYAVALALAGEEDKLAIQAKIELTMDQVEEIRDWATLGLGRIDLDTPEIRAALLARVSDSDEMTRGEALVGLARRKDPRGIEPLIRELERYYEAKHGEYFVEAAEEFADARLAPVLMKLRESADSETATRFDDAIRLCS